MSLIAEAKKRYHFVRLWKQYIDYRRGRKTVTVSATRHYNGTLLRSVFMAHFCVVSVNLILCRAVLLVVLHRRLLYEKMILIICEWFMAVCCIVFRSSITYCSRCHRC